MRITISHNKTQQEVMQITDKAVDDVFRGVGGGMVHLSDTEKHWEGNKMDFSLTARAGFLHAPIRGFVLVTDKDVTIDADLGMFEKFINQQQAKNAIETRVKGLLT